MPIVTKIINERVYGLLKIPDHTTEVKASADDDPDYTWLECNKSISKRIKLNLSEWEIIAPMGVISDKYAYKIGLMALARFAAESGWHDHQTLLLVKKYHHEG